MTVKPGQSLGQYRVIEQIGKGGMATVFRASQPSLSREVAIKVLPEFFAEEPAFHERFRQEAMAVASLRHPNILMVFDSGEAEGVAYIVTEFVDGGTLAEKLGKPLPVEYCLHIAKPIASALDYAHARGVIHRNVKPANILMTRDGTPILSDFGLARMAGGTGAANAATRLTVAGTSLGTPEYMAPEQIKDSDVEPSADIYALAVILYEMLTGTLPYKSDAPLSVLVARLKEPVPLPRERNPEISEAVQEVLLKGLAKEPSDRYHNALEMVAAIEAANQPTRPQTVIVPTPIPAVSGNTAAPRQKRSVVTGTIVGVVVAVIVAAVLIWPRFRSTTPSVGEVAGPAPAPVVAPGNAQPAPATSAPSVAAPVTTESNTPPPAAAASSDTVPKNSNS